MNYYCVACKVSKEAKVKTDIELNFSRILRSDLYFRVLFPSKQYKVKKGKVFIEVCKPITPGYLFIKSEKQLEEYSIDFRRITNCYGLVESQKTNNSKEKSIFYKLYREDLAYASWVFSHNGLITPSKITLEVGTCVNVISGPLATFNGQIIKVDKRNNKVCIFSENSGTLQKVWVPVEIVRKEDLDSNSEILKAFSKVY
jgi:transcription antitermination factor NusG